LKKISTNLQVFLKQDEFGSNCAVDKNAKMLVKLVYRPIYKRSVYWR